MTNFGSTPHRPPGLVGLSNVEAKKIFAFSDESYSDKVYLQGAYVIDADSLLLIEKAFQRSYSYAATFGIGRDVEFHGHSIMSSRKGWEILRNSFRAKIAIYQNILQCISDIPGQLIFQELEILTNKKSLANAPDAHLITFTALLFRLNSLGNSQGCSITIFADHLTREKELLKLFKFYKNECGLLPYISDIEHVDSKLHPGVQIADLCTYIYRRFRENNERDPGTRRAVENLWKIIEHKALKAPL